MSDIGADEAIAAIVADLRAKAAALWGAGDEYDSLMAERLRDLADRFERREHLK